MTDPSSSLSRQDTTLLVGKYKHWFTFVNLGLAQVGIAILGFTVNAILTHNVSLEVYGDYKFILALAS